MSKIEQESSMEELLKELTRPSCWDKIIGPDGQIDSEKLNEVFEMKNEAGEFDDIRRKAKEITSEQVDAFYGRGSGRKSKKNNGREVIPDAVPLSIEELSEHAGSDEIEDSRYLAKQGVEISPAAHTDIGIEAEALIEYQSAYLIADSIAKSVFGIVFLVLWKAEIVAIE